MAAIAGPVSAGDEEGSRDPSLEAAFAHALAGTEETTKAGSTDASVRMAHLLKVCSSIIFKNRKKKGEGSGSGAPKGALRQGDAFMCTAHLLKVCSLSGAQEQGCRTQPESQGCWEPCLTLSQLEGEAYSAACTQSVLGERRSWLPSPQIFWEACSPEGIGWLSWRRQLSAEWPVHPGISECRRPRTRYIETSQL